MAYINNIPQGNQQIATTQPMIQANFGFIQAAINQEHNFAPSDATKTFHLQASMPNRTDPTILPVGTDGMYYVNGGTPKFYNASGVNFLPYSTCSSFIMSAGPITITVSPTTLITLPAGSCGTYFVYRTSTQTIYAIGSFNCSSTSAFPHSDHSNGIIIGSPGSSLAITASTSPVATFNDIKWVFIINVP